MKSEHDHYHCPNCNHVITDKETKNMKNRYEVIKDYRDTHQCSLKDASQAVKKIEICKNILALKNNMTKKDFKKLSEKCPWKEFKVYCRVSKYCSEENCAPLSWALLLLDMVSKEFDND